MNDTHTNIEMMKDELVRDIIEWDVSSWSKALFFWQQQVDLVSNQYTCLELGGRGGGLSLWLALNRHHVICSDLKSPKKNASEIHNKYNCSKFIEYQGIDATAIPFKNKFDIVVFKSILGGVSANGNNELKKKTIEEIYKSLKPSGRLLFAENLEASKLHKTLRTKYNKWGSQWNYLKYDEIKYLFESFENVNYKTIGFFGTFGRTERQRKFLCIIDFLIKPLIPQKNRYIVFGIATK